MVAVWCVAPQSGWTWTTSSLGSSDLISRSSHRICVSCVACTTTANGRDAHRSDGTRGDGDPRFFTGRGRHPRPVRVFVCGSKHSALVCRNAALAAGAAPVRQKSPIRADARTGDGVSPHNLCLCNNCVMNERDVPATEVRQHFAAYLDEVRGGASFTITRGSRVAGRLVPPAFDEEETNDDPRSV
jgi:hypothetical protein